MKNINVRVFYQFIVLVSYSIMWDGNELIEFVAGCENQWGVVHLRKL